MKTVLFDFSGNWQDLLPLTYTRPISQLRIGILTIEQKWDKYLGLPTTYKTENYLQVKFKFEPGRDNYVINATVLPDKALVEAIRGLGKGEALYKDDIFLAARLGADEIGRVETGEGLRVSFFREELAMVTQLWHLFKLNGQELEKDFLLITRGRQSQKISSTNTVFEDDRIFLEPGAVVEAATLNPHGGYIYIGRDAEIMEGSVVRGSLAMCEHSVLKVSAKIYGPTTIGPYSKVGGEVNNSIIIGYSNKAHDGFLGNSVLGEWCNIGADSNNSNLKNNYAEVKLWNYRAGRFVSTGEQFCGLFMGDHSKCGINTMFNTGTVVGVSCNVFGADFPRKFIPCFSWGGYHGFEEYRFDKAMDTARRVMARRHIELTQADLQILKEVYTRSSKYRTFK